MTWAQNVKQEQKRMEREQVKLLQESGATVHEVTQSEYDDGLGVSVGLNVWRDGFCTTFAGALREIGDTRDARGEALRKFRN